MNCTLKLRKCKKEVAHNYLPPAMVTQVSARRWRQYQLLHEWLDPPGWSASESLLDWDVYLTLKSGLILRELKDSLAIHDPMTHDRHCLNETAAFLLLSCNGRMNFWDIVAEFALEFSVHAKEAKADAEGLLGELCKHKVIVLRPRKTYGAK